MTRPSLSRTGRVLSALVLCCLVAGLAPATATATAAPAPAPSSATLAKGKVKVDAKLDKAKVKKGEKVKLNGKLSVEAPAGRDTVTGDEPLIVQQQVSAGAWVDIATSSCRPNGGFSLSLSFTVSASLSLRVYHPETTIYASAYSSVFALVVI
ncbi:hypothetical protein [Amycolatopsis samaneae]|uniref:Uncharacterized protein n=1 Tax=Amycolatopsis samaneae TaxID=664691 RepID=A0ABW5GA18_9PSEU